MGSKTNKKKIVMTGGKGVVGTILRNGLKDYDITVADLPEVDVREYNKLLEIFPGNSAVIHLAWNTMCENFRSMFSHPDNSMMYRNVYEAAVESKVPRVIMASSVHTWDYLKWKSPPLLTPEKTPEPINPYGRNKFRMEQLGFFYSKMHRLQVVCPRLGGTNVEDRVYLRERGYKKIWLSHRDLVSLYRTCLEVPKIPGNFLVFYAVSNNTGRVHDYSNPLGWVPMDDAKEMLEKKLVVAV